MLPAIDVPALTVVPVSRTTTFMVRSLTRPLRAGRECPDLPSQLPTPLLAGSVLLDEMLRGVSANLSGPVAAPDVLARVSDEVDEALALFAARGWLDDPAGFHPAPPAPERVDVTAGWAAAVGYRHLTCDSGYQPVAGVPGAQRWTDQREIATAHAYVLQHAGAPRPWVVQLHGWMCGSPLDLIAMRSLELHHRLGYNVIHPVAPLHGPRRSERQSVPDPLSVDYLTNVHGMANAVWDVRRWIAHLRQLGAPGVAVHGISLGGFLAAMLAGLEPDLDAVIAGTPPAELGVVLSRDWRRPQRQALARHDLVGARLDAVHRVVCPLALPPVVARERRFIYAAIGDRATTPQQAYKLWEHWERHDIHWHNGSHLTSFSPATYRFLSSVLSRTIGADHAVAS